MLATCAGGRSESNADHDPLARASGRRAQQLERVAQHRHQVLQRDRHADAPAAGVVSFAAKDLFLTGGTVLIDHGYGLDSSFLHMSRVDVKVGQRVKRGDIIGLAGMTGRATGPHVHWGFNWFEVRLDPALLPKPQY